MIDQGTLGLSLAAPDHQVRVIPETALLTPHVRRGLSELLRAFEYAKLTRRNLWNFAVEISHLKSLELNECDFRWLTCLGYVEHACETTRLDEDGREFRSTGDLTYVDRSCFILTEAGAAFAKQQAAQIPLDSRASSHVPRDKDSPFENPSQRELTPNWDCERHELRLAGKLVKQFKWPAINQETILTAFQEEEWTARVDDPLPPQYDLDPRRRLHDTIKCLNRNQKQKLIHFRGDGTGEGVVWELIPQEFDSH